MLLNNTIGITNGDNNIVIAFPIVKDNTIASGGYGICILSKIPVNKTIAVSGPSPMKPRRRTKIGIIDKMFIVGTTSCITPIIFIIR